jgi:hypothetical protein
MVFFILADKEEGDWLILLKLEVFLVLLTIGIY